MIQRVAQPLTVGHGVGNGRYSLGDRSAFGHPVGNCQTGAVFIRLVAMRDCSSASKHTLRIRIHPYFYVVEFLELRIRDT